MATDLREAHLRLLADHVLSRLCTWCMPADWGLDYATEPTSLRGAARTYTSAEEVLSIIEYTPEPDWDAGEEWPYEAREYAKNLWLELPEHLRKAVRSS